MRRFWKYAVLCLLAWANLGMLPHAIADIRAGYWVDAHGQASISDVRALSTQAFTAVDLAQSPSIRTYAVVWLRLELNPSGEAQPPWILEFRNRRIPDLQVFTQNATLPLYTLGFRHPVQIQPLPHRYFALPIDAQSARHPVFVRMELLSRADLSLVATPEPIYPSAWLDDHMAQAAYFGLAIGLIVFNALLGLALRDRVYAFYVAASTAMLINIAVTSGMGRMYLWSHSPWWDQTGNLISAQVAIYCLCHFVLRVLELPRLLPPVAGLLVWVARSQFFFFAILLVMGEAAFQASLQIVGVISALFFPILGYCIWHRVPGARWVLMAFLALLLGTLLNVLWSFQLFPDTAFSRNGSQIGSALEMVLLAFLLADRFARMQKAKLLAESEARLAHEEALLAERARVDTLRESERLLESRVQERTLELQETLAHLQKTQENLIQAEKLSALGAMVAGVSHELNTPLGVVVTASSTLGELAIQLQSDFVAGQLTRTQAQNALQDVREGSELIHRSAERAAQLVRSFKQVAVDQVSERKRGFDLRQVVEENLVAMRASLKCEPWPVRNEVPQGLECDSFPGPLGQILTNLVMNAIYHGFADRPIGTIVIEAHPQGPLVALSVRDDGRGMDARTVARVFEPFFTTRLGKGGSGLGLSVSHRMATTLLQGDLQVESQPNIGTTFTLTFARQSSLGG